MFQYFIFPTKKKNAIKVPFFYLALPTGSKYVQGPVRKKVMEQLFKVHQLNISPSVLVNIIGSYHVQGTTPLSMSAP